MAFPELLLGWFLVLWAPALPEPCWLPSLRLLSCLSSIMILRICTFRGCHLAHAPPRGAFVKSHLPSPLHPQFEHSTIFMARHATGNFTRIHPQSAWFGGCVHSSAQPLPFLQRSLVSRILSRAGQNSGDRRSQLFKCCFHSASEQITLSFLFQSHEMKTLGKGDRGKHLVFFCCYCCFTWFWKHGHVVIPRMKYIPQYPVSCWLHPIVLSASQLLLIAIPCFLWDCTPTSRGSV